MQENPILGVALHMAMLILFSNLYGWLFREWQGVGTAPKRVLQVGMAIIVVATLIITYGNYRGQQDAPIQAPQQKSVH